MENYAAVGHWELNNKITIWTSTQVPFLVRDEVAGLFEDCARDYNLGLLPLLLKLDGAPDHLDSDLTISRGLVEVRDIGINLIGTTTPAALREHAAKPHHWANGLFGRFCIDEPDEAPRWAFWSRDDGQGQINDVVRMQSEEWAK